MIKKTRFIHTTRKSKQKLLVAIVSSRPEYRKKYKGPKSLYKTDGINIIEKQSELLNILSGEIVVSLGFKFDKVIDAIPNEVRVVENINFESTNDIEDIRLCMNNYNSSSLLFIDGNILPSKAALSKINFEQSSILVSEKLDNIGVVTYDDLAKNFHYDSSIKHRWTSIAYLAGKEFDHFKQLCCRENNTKISHELLNEIIDSSGQFKIIIDNETKKI